MEKILNDFTSVVRKAVDEYHMIGEGDRIAVGVSGRIGQSIIVKGGVSFISGDSGHTTANAGMAYSW